ncbi:MAG: outer membrane lipoprotein-sorting protein [Desulfobacter sp.]|nr:outer membrane lipoprotein-sorting protein [Desulfobacter sp.]WDP84908.1 MAG: outer membrane lipoprotein-sorting protein [Desulfobacter sp.]
MKRIAPGDKSSAFMGSDFSYSDINGMEIKDWDYKFAKENFDLNGVETWVISGRPKAEARKRVEEETGYSKILIWVRKDNFIAVKAKYWVTKGKKIKYFKAQEIKKIDGILTPLKMTMVTMVKGKVSHSTVLVVSNLQYNLPVQDHYFTPRRMEQGL